MENTLNIQILSLYNTPFTTEHLLHLIKDAFKERKDAGLNYVCLSMTHEDFVKELDNSVPIVAYNKYNNTLCGCSILKLCKDKNGQYYGVEKHTSVLPMYKNQGLGSKLIKRVIEIAKKYECKYLLCSTAKSATSAIKVHKKNGYKIVGLASYKNTNYYSYKFRLNIYPSTNKNYYFRKLYFIKSVIKTILLYQKDGSFTTIHKWINKYSK